MFEVRAGGAWGRVGCRSSVRNARGMRAGCGGRVEGARCTGGTLVRARAVGRTVVFSALGADVRGCARERVGARRVQGACGGAGFADGHAGGGRERLRARARGARGSRLKFCLVRQTSTGALARGRRVRGCARAGHVGAQGERGRACAGASGWPDGRSLDVRRAGLHNSFAVLLAASKGLRTAETTQMRLSSEQTVKGFSILFCSRRALSLQ